MSRALLRLLPLAALLLLGCDKSKSRFEEASTLAVRGKLADAADAFDKVCEPSASSERCAIARRKAGQLRMQAGLDALGADRFAEAQVLFEKAKQEPSTSLAAEAALAQTALVDGLALARFEQSPSQPTSLEGLRAIAQRGTPSAPRARELLREADPPSLLTQAIAACKPEGEGSCSQLAATLAARYPGTEQDKQAQSLAQAELERAFPTLDALEKLLSQRASLQAQIALKSACEHDAGGATDAGCDKLTPSPSIDPATLDEPWAKHLAALSDPELRARFGERWELARTQGNYELQTWPKPNPPAATSSAQ